MAGKRRVARLVPAQSPQWVLLQVMREVLDPSWAPGVSALRVLEQVHDPQALRHARARLRLASRERTTLSQARALATLNLAINRLDDEDDSDTAYTARSHAQGGRGNGR
jgi:hypothetical protein